MGTDRQMGRWTDVSNGKKYKQLMIDMPVSSPHKKFVNSGLRIRSVKSRNVAAILVNH